MRLAIVVLAHDAPDQLARLLTALRHPLARLYLHVDRRVPMAPFARALEEAGLDDVALLPRHPTGWASVGLVDAALEGLVRGIADGCDYFFLISGRDFPLRPVEEIAAFAEEAGARSYVEHFPLPDPRWRFEGRERTDFYSYDVRGRRETCIPRGEDTSRLSWKGRLLNEALRARTAFKGARGFPPYARPFGGSQWWNLSRVAADHVLRFLDDHPDYRRYHEHTLAPDELFFQSILVGTGFAAEHEVVDDSLRFLRWPEDESSPRSLTVGDIPALGQSEALFCRKLDPVPDPELLDWLRRRMAARK